ncbi:MAG: hypothetical protein ABIY51_12005 [Ferruginibacter sp.]
MKKILTILFLFIISIQCLPVKEMGKCLFNNQFLEEELAKKGIEKPACCKEFVFSVSTQLNLINDENVVYSNNKTLLLSHPVADITTPPPNTFLS